MKIIQAHHKALTNLDMCIKREEGGIEKEIDRNELQSLSLQNHQYARSSLTYFLD